MKKRIMTTVLLATILLTTLVLPLHASDQHTEVARRGIPCYSCGSTNTTSSRVYTKNLDLDCYQVYYWCNNCSKIWYGRTMYPHQWAWNSGDVKYCVLCNITAVGATR